MFIAETFPLWGILVAGVVFVIVLVFSSRSIYDTYAFSVLVAFAYSQLFSLFLIGAVLYFPALGEKTFSNPAQRPPLSIKTFVNKEEMNAKIAETIGIDKVSMKVDDGGSWTVNSLGQGDIFSFTAIDNGSKINGSFYFNDDTMEIIVEDAEQVKQEFSVSID